MIKIILRVHYSAQDRRRFHANKDADHHPAPQIVTPSYHHSVSMRLALVGALAVAMIMAISSFCTVYADDTPMTDVTTVDAIPLTPTNWERTLSIPRFEPATGILTRIEFVLTGQVNGAVRIENLDAAPAQVTAEIIADIALERPDGAFITMASPNAAKTVSLAEFDGSIDFDGASGTTVDNIVGIDISDRTVYTDGTDLAAFVGSGLIDLTVKATGRSRATGAGNLGLSFSTLAGAAITVTYTYTQPAILLEKATNGSDADLLPGPTLLAGGPVTWTYVVTNIGGTPLEDLILVDDQEGNITTGCPQTTLAVGETMTCIVTGIAQHGQYTNTAVVTGTVPSNLPGAPRQVTDSDPSHYTGVGEPAIDLEKLTNGEDADLLPGPLVAAGGMVTWTYIVRNIGEIDLENLTLLDDREGDVTGSCPQTTLAVGEMMRCVVSGIAQQGQYTNTAVVTGTTPSDSVAPNTPVTDSDPSHYTGMGAPAIDLEKLTNG
ncbi:MAG: choice-of-anchor E domain-containing protein, partial [Caldilineaceae bacterium]|nr:choice-of-anchor E domain-containing protein [Caldilineaceae bacterium]